MGPDVVVVGSVNEDLVTFVERLPNPGETVLGGSFQRGLGGKGANQALAAARLGARVAFVGLVGDDDAGRRARAELAAGGVDAEWLATGTSPTGTAQILVDASGENLIAVASGANAELDAEAVDGALQKLLSSVRPIVLANLEVPDDAVLAAARAAVAGGCPFILNPAPARQLPEQLLQLCTILTPNEHELTLLAARASSAPELLALGVRSVVVTRGPQGADVYLPGRPPHHQPAFPVAAVDSTGAGDAFSGALASALTPRIAGQKGRIVGLEEAVRWAAAAGAFATQAAGAQGSLPDRPSLEAFIAAADGGGGR